MNEIKKQVDRARFRIMLGELITIGCWSLFVGLMLASIALTIPKIWHLEFLEPATSTQAWNYSWMIAGLMVGVLCPLLRVTFRRQSQLAAAVEVDQRFKLKSRLSSALSLSKEEVDSEAGRALLHDAQRRAETIDVREQFHLQPSWKVLLPLLPMAFLIGLLFTPNAEAVAKSGTQTNTQAEKKSKTVVKEVQKKLKKQLEAMESKGLKDSRLDLESLARKIDNLSNKPGDQKRDALVKLNDLKKQLDERRAALGDSNALKEQLLKMNNVSQGPAKQLTDALGEGNFKEARKAIKELVEKLKAGDLNQIEQQKLADDLIAMADQIDKMAKENARQKEQLQTQIDQAAKKGDIQKAAKLQQQLNQLKRQDPQMQEMQQMSQNLRACADCMKQGQGPPKQGQQGAKRPAEGGQDGPSHKSQMEAAAQSLEEMAKQLQKMQQEIEALQDLEEMLDEVAQGKSQCQGDGQKGKPSWNDWAGGQGTGGGKRSRENSESGSYKSRVEGKLQQGETVVTGNADGDNANGKTSSQVRELVESALSKKSDPLENQKLPKSQREHVQQYFNKLRTGK
ncbi:MAG: hypothetical protein MK106_08950 [Mariniblastus sp.]|nr:hypothetical protein [Mariniblastus sp.]